MLKQLAVAAALMAAATASPYAQQPMPAAPVQSEILSTLPTNATTVTNYYKQYVYDHSDSKVGEITDVLVGKDGKIEAFMISVGGFLGMGEKDVAVPFHAVSGTQKNGKWYLTIDTTKEVLKNAHGYKYDRVKTTWDPV